jgi:hypothetical protein
MIELRFTSPASIYSQRSERPFKRINQLDAYLDSLELPERMTFKEERGTYTTVFCHSGELVIIRMDMYLSWILQEELREFLTQHGFITRRN